MVMLLQVSPHQPAPVLMYKDLLGQPDSSAPNLTRLSTGKAAGGFLNTAVSGLLFTSFFPKMLVVLLFLVRTKGQPVLQD